MSAPPFIVTQLYDSDIPMVVTEQYPKALGHTSRFITTHLRPTDLTILVSSLDISRAKVFEKAKFSMLTDEVASYLEELRAGGNRRAAVLFGCEAHVCVQQTALDLLEAGFVVHVVADAVSSQVS